MRDTIRASRGFNSTGCILQWLGASPQHPTAAPETSLSARPCPLETAGLCAACRRQPAAAVQTAVPLRPTQPERRHLGMAAAALRPAAACLAARHMPCAAQCAAGPAHMLRTSHKAGGQPLDCTVGFTQDQYLGPLKRSVQITGERSAFWGALSRQMLLSTCSGSPDGLKKGGASMGLMMPSPSGDMMTLIS